jgi:hypothetical protein
MLCTCASRRMQAPGPRFLAAAMWWRHATGAAVYIMTTIEPTNFLSLLIPVEDWPVTVPLLHANVHDQTAAMGSYHRRLVCFIWCDSARLRGALSACMLLWCYRAAMREAGFDGRTVLYVASALLSYKGGPEELQQVGDDTLLVLITSRELSQQPLLSMYRGMPDSGTLGNHTVTVPPKRLHGCTVL